MCILIHVTAVKNFHMNVQMKLSDEQLMEMNIADRRAFK